MNIELVNLEISGTLYSCDLKVENIRLTKEMNPGVKAWLI
jgi:hypothetical protein